MRTAGPHVAPAAGLDRRALGTLGFGHLCVDLTQGALPALLPFLAAQRGYSYGALGALLLASSVGSSVIQPLFGQASDRVSLPWLMPLGVLLAGAGLAGVGLVESYAATVAAVAVSGLGVAAFHPEGARYANLVSGARRGRGMSLFSLGGNAGFALGPALATPLVLLFGLGGTAGLLVFPLLAAVLMVRELGRLAAHRPAAGAASARGEAAGEDRWGPFARLGGVIALRSVLHFGLLAFVPLWFVTRLGTSEALGNVALTTMLVAGALGTLAGGVLVDRFGARAVLVGSLVALVPVNAVLPLAPTGAAVVALALIGFFAIASFSVTVVLGQEYLPRRLGLASGITLGLAIGLGGVAAAGLGLLADRAGLDAVMWLLAGVPLVALALALTLPTARARMSRAEYAHVTARNRTA